MMHQYRCTDKILFKFLKDSADFFDKNKDKQCFICKNSEFLHEICKKNDNLRICFYEASVKICKFKKNLNILNASEF